jgi:hypothetical protein
MSAPELSRAPSVSGRKEAGLRSALPHQPHAGPSSPKDSARSEKSHRFARSAVRLRIIRGGPDVISSAPRQPFVALAPGLRPRSPRGPRGRDTPPCRSCSPLPRCVPPSWPRISFRSRASTLVLPAPRTRAPPRPTSPESPSLGAPRLRGTAFAMKR